MPEKLNIIFWNANYYGTMAQSQRIKNLIDPLLQKPDVQIHNLVGNDKIPPTEVLNRKVPFTSLSYSIKNPFTIIRFIALSYSYLKKVRERDSKNILYSYSSPCIENFFLLYFARRMGYKLVFDITEDVSFADFSKSPWHVKFYHSSALRMRRYIPKWGSACFAISEYLLKYCENLCMDKIPVYFLPICVDIKKIGHYKSPKFENNTSLKIFYGGSFGYKDGIQFLLEGFEMAAKKNEKIHLLLTGRISRQFESEFQYLLSKSVVKDRIAYLGCLSEHDFFTAMVNSDIMCMVRINSEFANAGFPFKLGEYLASGNAVLATKIGNVEKYLQNGKNAYLINPESPSEIAEAINKLASDKSLREKIGESGKLVAIEYFDNYKVVDNLYRILLDI